MTLSENTKRFLFILGLISFLYLLTYIQHLLDPQTWHYNMSMILTSCVSGLGGLWLFITALKFSNDFFDWNLERFAVCSCEDVEWVEGVPADTDFPVLVNYNNKFIVVHDWDETSRNCLDWKEERLGFYLSDIERFLPLSHLTDEDKK